MRDTSKQDAGPPQLRLSKLMLSLALTLAGLTLLLPIGCGPASTPVTPVTQAPQASTSTPMADNTQASSITPVVEETIQTPEQEATPIQASSETSGETPVTGNLSRDAVTQGQKDTSEPVPQSDGKEGKDQAPAIPDKRQLKYPNLGSRLNEIATSVEAGLNTNEEAAKSASIHSGASVAVTIHLSGNVDDVVTFLENNGGDPRNTGEDYIEAYVPVPLLGPVSEQPGVTRVREIVPPDSGRSG